MNTVQNSPFSFFFFFALISANLFSCNQVTWILLFQSYTFEDLLRCIYCASSEKALFFLPTYGALLYLEFISDYEGSYFLFLYNVLPPNVSKHLAQWQRQVFPYLPLSSTSAHSSASVCTQDITVSRGYFASFLKEYAVTIQVHLNKPWF